MAVKLLTQIWRDEKINEKRQFEAGEIDASECCMAELFPDEFINETEPLLQSLADRISDIDELDYPAVSDAIKTLVMALNQINEKFDQAVIETGEREQLCQFIEDVIEESAVDLGKYAVNFGCDSSEITDTWRDW
jgi:hypothetical protein